MPIYEYMCDGCGRKTEVIQKFSDAPLERCAECGGALKKLISNTSFVLKGSGWYADGYASASGNAKAEAAAGAESPAPAKPESKPEAKPESKPEAKPETKAEAKAAAPTAP